MTTATVSPAIEMCTECRDFPATTENVHGERVCTTCAISDPILCAYCSTNSVSDADEFGTCGWDECRSWAYTDAREEYELENAERRG